MIMTYDFLGPLAEGQGIVRISLLSVVVRADGAHPQHYFVIPFVLKQMFVINLVS